MNNKLKLVMGEKDISEMDKIIIIIETWFGGHRCDSYLDGMMK